MADTQEQSLTATAALLTTDLVRVVTDPGGAPASKIITFANLQAAITTLVSLTDIMVVPYQVRTTAAFDKTSDTALANIPDLTVTLVAGKNYRFEAWLHTTTNASGGVKVSMAGTATAGAIIYDANSFYGANTIHYRYTALAESHGATAAATDAFVQIMGLISVTVGGTLTVQFAQNASFATKSTVNIGSTLMVWRLA